MRKSILIIGLVAAFSIPSISMADFRCKHGALVNEGNTKSEVKLKCGPPMSSSYEGVVKINGKWVYLDRWVYNPGPGQFYQILDFYDGVLSKIRNGPRVPE